MTNNGFLLVATSETHVRAANMAAKSIQDHMPDAQIDIFCDLPKLLDPKLFSQINVMDNPHRRSKVDCLSLSRFDRTIYIDSDVRLVSDLTELFGLMDRFDLAMAHGHARNNPKDNSTWKTSFPPSFPQYNSGVFVYKSENPKVIEFLDYWKNVFHETGFHKDQITLRELLWETNLRLYTLPPEYNVRYAKYLSVWDDKEAVPRVLHFKQFKNEHTPFQGIASLKGNKKTSLFSRIRTKLFRFEHFVPKRKIKQKVFCIGFHKTGTTSLTKALKILGYKTIHGDGTKTWEGADEGKTLTKMIDEGNFDIPTLDMFDAFSDNPYFSIWKELDKRPDSKFILTIRDPDRWIESACKFYKDRRVRHMRQWMFGEYADPSSSPEAKQKWLDAYNAHNDAILAYFKGKDNFLVMDVTKNANWETLCEFLGKPIPRKPFPHVNKTKKAMFGEKI